MAWKIDGLSILAGSDSLYPQVVVGQEEETATSRQKSNNNNNNKGSKFHPGQVKKCLGTNYYVTHISRTRSGILPQDAF